MDVFLDTQVLRSDPFWRRAPSVALKLLASTEVVRVHISDVTAREFVAWRVSEADAVARTAETALRKANLFAGQDLAAAIDDVASKLASAAAAAKTEMQAAFDRWCADLRVTVWPVGNHHGRRVVDAYFSGSAPFRQAKERSDFPDAFIFEAFRDMAATSQELAFVSGDERFAAGCQRDFPDAKVFSTVDDLLRLEQVTEALREKTVAGQFEQVGPLLQRVVLESDVARDQVAAALVGRRIVVHYPIAGAATIEKTHGVRATFVGGTLQYFGAGIVTLPFSARAIVDLVAIQDATKVDMATIANYGAVRRAEDDTVEVLLNRMLVVSGQFLVALPRRVFETTVAGAELEDAIRTPEIVLDSMSVFGERASAVSMEDLMEHASHEAGVQIEAGDFDTSLDEAEEADRKARAQWHDVPAELTGKRGKITIGDNAKFKIAPLPRFENLVRIAKRALLQDDDTGPNSESGEA